MSAAIDDRPSSPEIVSPELVLVDSVLARREQALLPDLPIGFGRSTRVPDETTAQNAGATSRLAEVPPVPPTPLRAVPHVSADANPVPSEPTAPTRPSVFPFSFPDDGHFMGVREAGVRNTRTENEPDSAVLRPRESSRDRVRRRLTLVPTSSAALAVSVLVLQLYLEHGTLA